jgi:hypothetical protein
MLNKDASHPFLVYSKQKIVFKKIEFDEIKGIYLFKRLSISYIF